MFSMAVWRGDHSRPPALAGGVAADRSQGDSHRERRGFAGIKRLDYESMLFMKRCKTVWALSP